MPQLQPDFPNVITITITITTRKPSENTNHHQANIFNFILSKGIFRAESTFVRLPNMVDILNHSQAILQMKDFQF